MSEELQNKKEWRRFSRLKVEKGTFKRRARKIESATLKHAHRFLIRRWTNVRDVGRHTVGWLVLVGLLIGLSFLQVVWFAHAYMTSAPEEGGTYAEGMIGRLETMNPLFVSTTAEVSASKLIFSGLLSYDRDDQLRPELASSWNVSDDGKTYTVQLRKDAYWHDGKKLTADDVVFTIRLIQNPATKAVQYGSWAGVKVEKVSETEVRFLLPSVYAPFAQALTVGILPEHLLKQVQASDLRENDFSRKPVGTGPFVFRRIQLIDPNRDRLVVHMEANKQYYRASVQVNRFQLHTYENRDALKRALKTSEVNAVLGLGADQIDDLAKQNGFVAATNKVSDGMFALFNNDQPIVKDGAVRQALLLGTNRPKVLSAVYGRGSTMNGPFPDTLVAGGVVQSPYNPKAAAEKLDAAGWKLVDNVRQKDGVKLELTVVAPDTGDYKLILQELAIQWKTLGVTVKTQLADPGTIEQDFLQPRSYDVLIYELAIGSDPDVYPYWHSSQANPKGLNLANYRSGLADDALSSAKARLDPALRLVKYKTFYEQWVKDTPAIALYQPYLSYVTNESSFSLETDEPVADQTTRYRNIERWAASQAPVLTTR